MPDSAARPLLLHKGTFMSLLALQAIYNLNHLILYNEADVYQAWLTA